MMLWALVSAAAVVPAEAGPSDVAADEVADASGSAQGKDEKVKRDQAGAAAPAEVEAVSAEVVSVDCN